MALLQRIKNLASRAPSLRSGVSIPRSIPALVAEANAAYDRLRALKAASTLPGGAQWYPYDSMGNVEQIASLLGALPSGSASIAEILGNGPLLDLCCGDGDLSYFLHHLGYAVTAIDWPETNYNAMTGVGELNRLLQADVQIHQCNLDDAFQLPATIYRAVFFLGGLYHLKNPFYVMEKLALTNRFCFLSTRITRFSADKQTDLEHLPVAYLLSESESNADATNFWIFSKEGLRVLLDRAGWSIRSSLFVGDNTSSDPVSLEGDQRAFYLLESKHNPSPKVRITLGEGWHPEEGDAWRWVERRFTLQASAAKAQRVSLQLVVPEALLAAVGPITLRCSVNDEPAGEMLLTDAGEYLFQVAIQPRHRAAKAWRIVFETDKWIPADPGDNRERALIVRSESLADAVQ